MSRRSLPDIAPTDLRDHADDARMARVWERIERDLPASPVQASRGSTGWALALVAATVAAFGGGVLAGKATWGGRVDPPAVAIASSDRPAVEVFAAGTDARTFPLPGGGRLTLGPGATVEVERATAGALTLRLVQGEASVDTSGSEGASSVAIVAEEARLSTQAGSAVVVRRGEDTLDVSVVGGAVQLDSPDGSRQLGRGQHAEAVPLRALAFDTAAPAATARRPVASSRSMHEPREAPASAAGAQEWRARYAAYDWAEAFKLLKAQPGGVNGAIDAAQTAEELTWISDLAATAGEQSAALRALKQLVDRFPSAPYAQLAAVKLGDAYEKTGETALAQKYLERAQSQDGVFAEDALCRLMRAAQREDHKKEASRMAEEYAGKYPNGRCRDEADQVLHGDDASPEGSDVPQARPADAGAP